MDFQAAKTTVDAVVNNISKVIYGKEAEIRQAIACWLSGGHVLFEDVPGTGKTILARAIAASIGTRMKRVQFTPDLLPGDIVGTSIYNKDKGTFVFNPGPIFCNVLLADEINRATPRTQSALLEAMAEGQCTAENRTYKLPANFFVIATQNPVEQHGTFPLPEAQLDRFMMRISLGYPDPEVEINVVKNQLEHHPIDNITAVVNEEDWQKVRDLVKHVNVSHSAISYAQKLVGSTRSHQHLVLGGSPRATIALIRGAQAYSLMLGQDYVKPDFIKNLAGPVLEHRIALSTKARLDQVIPRRLVSDLLSKIPVPTR